MFRTILEVFIITFIATVITMTAVAHLGEMSQERGGNNEDITVPSNITGTY